MKKVDLHKLLIRIMLFDVKFLLVPCSIIIMLLTFFNNDIIDTFQFQYQYDLYAVFATILFIIFIYPVIIVMTFKEYR
jgi:hypothetical protein